MTEHDEIPASTGDGVANGQSEVWSGAPNRPADLRIVVALAVAALALPFAVLGVVLFAVLPGPWWLGLFVGVGVAAVVIFRRLGRADEIVLSRFSLVQAPARYERLLNMVEGLTLAGGVVPPEVLILDDGARNGMAIRRHDRNHLIFTRGLIDALDVVELEGAVAELLSRLRNGDAEAATIGAALFGGPVLDGPLASVLSPLGQAGLARLLNDGRDIEADRQAVSLTRYPPGLQRALATMASGETGPDSVTAGTAHLWLADPDESAAGASRSPLSLRVDVLAEL